MRESMLPKRSEKATRARIIVPAVAWAIGGGGGFPRSRGKRKSFDTGLESAVATGDEFPVRLGRESVAERHPQHRGGREGLERTVRATARIRRNALSLSPRQRAGSRGHRQPATGPRGSARAR